ncbi:MAG TPA: cyclic nucleotide-binding domain-containing protein [Anaeromyxobacteraceae bacterium]|nr:cyclic nucleotide-binding domain-containing protein [Anaeromyxobacteraceae bacterium]
MDALQALKTTFLFRDVPESVLKIVAQCAEERTLPGGDPIAAEEQAVDALYVVLSGSVQGFRHGDPTQFMLGPGQAFGQLSLIDGGPLGLSATTVEPTKLLVLRAAKLREALAGNHEAGHHLFRAVARSLAGRLRGAMRAVELTA